jgi:hypothetical protein
MAKMGPRLSEFKAIMIPGVMQYAAKHAVAATVVIACVAAFTVVSYFALLLWCVFAGAPVGGPLAMPFALLFAITASAVSVVGVLWPVTTLTDLLCRRFLHWHRIVQIPVATLLMFLYVTCWCLLVGLVTRKPAAAAIEFGAVASAVLLVPLGAYWWSLQAVDGILGVAARIWRRAGN